MGIMSMVDVSAQRGCRSKEEEGRNDPKTDRKNMQVILLIFYWSLNDL